MALFSLVLLSGFSSLGSDSVSNGATERRGRGKKNMAGNYSLRKRELGAEGRERDFRRRHLMQGGKTPLSHPTYECIRREQRRSTI